MLENNQFALLPATLDEGRTIVDNLRRSAKLFLLKNVYTLLLVIVAVGILGMEFPYLPQQVTLLNALTIGGPAFLIMLRRQAGGTQGDSLRHGFLREVGWFAVVNGLIMGAAGLTVWLCSAWVVGDEQETRRTLLLSTLILIGLGNMLLVAERDPRLFAWAALALPLYGGVMYVGPLARFFALTPLTMTQWVSVATATAAALPVCILVEWWNRRLQRSEGFIIRQL